MSLRPEPIGEIPAETARVAHAAFPKGTVVTRLRDEFDALYEDEDFRSLYPARGQPGLTPWRLALVTVFQFLEHLSDRQAAHAVRARIDWKYALALELTDPGFHACVLCEFRARLLAGAAEQRLFDTMLMLFKEHGLVKAKGRQRTDATHVLAAIHVLNRLECMGETLRQALNTLATTDPEWLQTFVPIAWYTRYGRRIEEYRLPDAKADRYALAEAWGADGRDLLTQLYAADTDPMLRDLPAVQALQTVWLQQFYAVPPEAPMRWRKAEDL